mmetsp:Transcript_19261/g.45373  ORF Transcript_19261/g.45373 Transcript_19261/m.45373 type:complete len:145 (-) Transcript_19261:365-799(-)
MRVSDSWTSVGVKFSSQTYASSIAFQTKPSALRNARRSVASGPQSIVPARTWLTSDPRFTSPHQGMCSTCFVGTQQCFSRSEKTVIVDFWLVDSHRYELEALVEVVHARRHALHDGRALRQWRLELVVRAVRDANPRGEERVLL